MDVVEPYPRVSLVLIAFRQERFIRDAVRSALAQDYPNLQIVLSDDCSPDATFEAMRAEADTYDGPHELLVRQPPQNLGLVGHLYDAAALSKGELIVIAAGDDISYPQRVSRLVEVWQSTGAMALSSNWDEIDEAGRTIRRGRPSGTSDLRLECYFPGRRPVPLAGATSAYARDVFVNIPRPTEPIFAEDLYFTLMLAAWRRPVAYLEESLVGYRVHAAALTHVDRRGEALVDQERATARWSGQMATLLRLVGRQVSAGGPLGDWGKPIEPSKALADDIAFNEFRSTWLDSGVRERLRALARFRDPGQRRWLLPRLLGTGGVAALRRLRTLVGAGA